MILIITGGIVFLLALMLFIKQRRVQSQRKIQQQGIIYIGKIKKIITLVQQHRGLMSAWLNGDTKAHTKLMLLKQQISQFNKELDTSSVKNNERWTAFSDHWQRLLQVDNKPSASNSFEQHTMMIRNLAYLLEDTAEKAFLTADFLPALPNVGFVWRELVLATENIGQSRALGTGVAAQGYCSSVDKIRLNFLTQTMTKIMEHTLKHLSFLPQEKPQHQQLIDSAGAKMHQLISTISNELINTRNISVNNEDYFDLATDTMKEMNGIFDHQMKQVNSLI